MKANGAEEIYIPAFFTSEIGKGEWSASRSFVLSPEKITPYPLDRRLGGPQGWTLFR
jgi:hypothetical protein